MKKYEVKLNNYGLYHGTQTFDLRTTGSKNIILIGGENGHGKTTLFDAIKLALYGKKSADFSLTNQEYQELLFSKIHDSASVESADHAGIEVEFEHSVLGEINKYRIKRFWNVRNNKIIEDFEVSQNGKTLDDFSFEQWEDFINDLIPQGLAKLFFFDGEKIQNLAEDKNNQYLSDAFKSLLGIDLIEKLKADLRIYLIRNTNGKESSDIEKEVTKLNKNKIILSKQIDGIDSNIEKNDLFLKKNIKQIKYLENALSVKGGNFARDRDSLKQKSNELDVKINFCEEKIRSMCNEQLPFIFSPKLNLSLLTRLKVERESKHNQIAFDKVISAIKEIKNELVSSKKNDKSVLNILDNKIKSFNIEGDQNEVHKISDSHFFRLTNLIGTDIDETKKGFINLVKDHEQLTYKKTKLVKQLGIVPDELDLKPYFEKLGKCNKKLGEFNSFKKQLLEKKKTFDFKINQLERDIDKKIDMIRTINKKDEIIQSISKVESVLTEYHGKLHDFKMKEFSKYFLMCFDSISKKKNIFSKVELDPKTFNVYLWKYSNNKRISKNQLSTGEKQLYAIAVLWTLIKISQRPLPFIIDTPLARLDVKNRNNIVNNFFPNASHQIIILSTDTEIDQNYHGILKNKISREMVLDFNDEKTRIIPGYFWGEK